jgi:ankyrin repeat protein
VGKYTPLSWASYKGWYKVVWILLKQNMSPLDIDMHGNTAVHQAAASGSKKVLECFLSRGVDVEIKNARGHSPLDLATAPDVRELIQKATSTKICADKTCKSKFDFKNIRYYCESCKKFFCLKCSKSMYGVGPKPIATREHREQIYRRFPA